METSLVPEVADDALYGEVVRRILAAGSPDAIILFGSRARGDARPDSDVDILIIEDSTLPRWHRSQRYYRALGGIGRSKDVVVWTQAEIDEWSRVKYHFITCAVREGRVLYARRCRSREGVGPEGGERPGGFAAAPVG